jgi:hypothetical protein
MRHGKKRWGVCGRVGGLLVLCVMWAGVGSAYGLDGQQAADLGKAQTAVKNGEADLSAARGSAGTAGKPAKGSRAKLTVMRLDSAQKRLDEASVLLAKLPGDDGEVGALQGRYDAAVLGVAEVRAILNPGAPAESGEAKEAAASGSDAGGGQKAESPSVAKLDYKQEKLVKDARWYVRETEKYAGGAAEVVARLDGEGVKPVHSEVLGALEAVAMGWTKQKLAAEYIGQLPAGHPQVEPTAEAVRAGGDRLGALESRLKAVDVELSKITGMEHYPEYEKDYGLLRDLSGRYARFEITVQQPEKLARIIEEDGEVLKEIQRIARTYLPLVEQRTDTGVKMEQAFNHFQTSRSGFVGELIEYKNGLPAAFESDLKGANDLADQGVAEGKPGYFGENSGIAQRFGWAEQKLIVLRAFGEEEAKPYVERLEEVRGQIRERAKSLEAQIIAENALPNDAYVGGDRDELVKYAEEAWAEEQPGAEVLMARIPSQAWTRDTRWRWSSGAFYKIDASHVQVQLIVKHDEKLAVIRPINLSKNHLKGDTVAASALWGVDVEVGPRSYLLLEKVK